MKKQSIVFCVAVAAIIAILFLAPLFHPGIIAGHDAGYHFTRVQLFTQALKEGQLPVRWIEGPVPGLTHPLFEFYPPLFYYFVVPLMLIGVPYTIATYVVIAFAAILSVVGMYLFVKQLTNNPLAARQTCQPRLTAASLFAATLFLFTPYRISQLYVRAAYGEFLATAFVPWAFFAIYNLYNRYNHYNRYILVLALSLAAMVTGHQPTAIIVAFPLALWALYNFFQKGQVRELASVGIAGLLAFGLSAFFTIPLIAESGLIRAARLSTGYFDFRAHFAILGQLIYSAWGYGVSMRGPGDGMSFQVGIINWMVLLGAISLLLYNVYPAKQGLASRDNRYNNYIFFFLLISFFGVGMATDASAPLWERFSVLGYIQYPWRFLLIVSFATSALGGLVFYNLYPAEQGLASRDNRYIWLLLFIPILFNLKYLAPAAYMPPKTFDLGNPDLARYNSPENPFFGVELGYFPIWVSEVNTDPNVKRFTVIAGTAKVTATADSMTRQQARVEATQAATIRVNTHYFPGWMATIDDGKTKKTGTSNVPVASSQTRQPRLTVAFDRDVVPAYNNPLGNMEINLTPGDYKLSLNFGQTPIRRFADYLSLGTALGVVVWIILTISPKRFWSKYKGAISPARVKRSKA